VQDLGREWEGDGRMDATWEIGSGASMDGLQKYFLEIYLNTLFL
jgi:hypothetical protein